MKWLVLTGLISQQQDITVEESGTSQTEICQCKQVMEEYKNITTQLCCAPPSLKHCAWQTKHIYLVFKYSKLEIPLDDAVICCPYHNLLSITKILQ